MLSLRNARNGAHLHSMRQLLLYLSRQPVRPLQPAHRGMQDLRRNSRMPDLRHRVLSRQGSMHPGQEWAGYCLYRLDLDCRSYWTGSYSLWGVGVLEESQRIRSDGRGLQRGGSACELLRDPLMMYNSLEYRQ